MQAPLRRHESGTQSFARTRGGNCRDSNEERETLRVYYADKQPSVPRQLPEGLGINSGSPHSQLRIGAHLDAGALWRNIWWQRDDSLRRHSRLSR